MLIEPAILCPCPYRRSIPAHFPKLHITAPNTHHLQPIIGQFLREIAKSNIVGYQNTEMANASGVNFIIPTFTDVGAATATYDLQNIRIIDGYGDGETEFILGLNEFGALTYEDYYWCTYDDGAVSEEGADGWYPEGGGDPSDRITTVQLPLGTGLYLSLGTEGATVQYAGQVYTEGLVQDIPQTGVNFIGNATPVEIDLQDLKLIGAYGDGETEFILGLNEFGALTYEDYYWCTYDDGAVSEEGADGWYPEGGGEPADRITGVKLAPGMGVYLSTGTDDLKFSLPPAIKK